MWKMIMLFWSVPLALGIVMLARMAEGNPPVKDNEWQLLFGDRREVSWSPWVVIGFAVLAVVFFGIGFFEGLVVANFRSLWSVAAPLVTGVAAIFLLAVCLRYSSSHERVTAPDSEPAGARDDRSAGVFSR